MAERISYTATDGALAGVHLTGGMPATRQGIEVVAFAPIKHGGEMIEPCLRLAGRPDLEALVAAYRQAEEAERAELLARQEQQLPVGYREVAAAQDAADRARAWDRREWEREGVAAPRAPDAEEAARAACRRWPVAALWLAAEAQEANTSWSDPTGRVAAAKQCRAILRQQGEAGLAAARAALEVRRAAELD